MIINIRALKCQKIEYLFDLFGFLQKTNYKKSRR